jgi:hypothetical protein
MAEVQAQPEGWKKISEERTSQLDWVAPCGQINHPSDFAAAILALF